MSYRTERKAVRAMKEGPLTQWAEPEKQPYAKRLDPADQEKWHRGIKEMRCGT